MPSGRGRSRDLLDTANGSSEARFLKSSRPSRIALWNQPRRL